MPRTPRTPRTPSTHRRPGFLVALLAAVLLLTGACSSDDDGGKDTSANAATEAPSEVDALLASGLQQVSDQQYDAAMDTFRKVLDLDSSNVYATYNLGYIAQLRGDDGTAIQRYTAALGQDKEFAPALYNLAILTESSDLTAAVALYRREIAVKPDDAAAHMRLGFALRHLGQDAEADQMLQKGIEIDPSMADVESPTYS